MSGTKPWAIAIVILCTIFTSIGSTLLKTGANRLSFSVQGILSSYPIIFGLFFYFLGFVLLTTAFKHGELSVLFPFVSLSFIWVAIMSFIFLKEPFTLFKIIGVSAIVFGVAVIGLSSRSKKKAKNRGKK